MPPRATSRTLPPPVGEPRGGSSPLIRIAKSAAPRGPIGAQTRTLHRSVSVGLRVPSRHHRRSLHVRTRLDIAGAYLLGRGLLVSPIDIIRRATAYYGASPVTIVSAVKDKIDGVAGLGALAGGFLLQIAGYVAILASDAAVETGGWRAVVAVGGAAAAAALVLLARHGIERRATRRSLIELARTDPRTGYRAARPWGAMLLAFGKELGHPPTQDEPQDAYARRIWGVDDIEPGGPE
jgi:hypothetical protein